MAAYNSEQYISDAIQSVLDQTYENFELIIVNDGSQDNTSAIINSYSDSRIKILEFKENQGQSRARIYGISNAKGKFIAIFDSDDICFPDRFRLQVDYLEANIEIGVCGTLIELIDNSFVYPLRKTILSVDDCQ